MIEIITHNLYCIVYFMNVTLCSFFMTNTLEATMIKVGRMNPREIRKTLYETPNVETVDHCGVQL